MTQQTPSPTHPARSSFLRIDVLTACAAYGPKLVVPAGLSGVRVMTAFAIVESSLGVNCGPRYEAGIAALMSKAPAGQALLNEFGQAAASSFGPWQMLFDNFKGYTPAQLMTDLDACAGEFVRWFNSYVIGVHKAQTLQQMGQVWNAGHIIEPPQAASTGVQAYCSALEAAYNAA